MDKELRYQITLFRFALISPLVSRRGMNRGKQEARIKEITARTWEIPGSPRSSIARSIVLRWLFLYKRGGERLKSLLPQPWKDRGASRSLGEDIEASFLALRRENQAVSLPVLVKFARACGLPLDSDCRIGSLLLG